MKVTLQASNQFGGDYDTLGPEIGAEGTCWEIRKADGDFWAYCTFDGLVGLYIVNLQHLLIAHTENTETYWSTR